jgi:N-acetylneuraminic acid mutarotase
MRKTAATLMIALVLLAATCLTADSTIIKAEEAEDSWVQKEPLPTARSDLGVAVVKDKIYAIGGKPDYNTNEEYDPKTDIWTTKTPMPTARYRFGLAVYDNKIYCIGGQFSNRSINARTDRTGAIEVYDPKTDTWAEKAPMPNPRSQFQANVIDGKIYIMGGRTGGQQTTVSLNEVYDPNTETWVTKAQLIYPVVSYSSAVVGNKIYLFGGQNEYNETMNLAVTQIYDIETDTWSLGASLPTAVLKSAAGVTSGTLVPQKIYVVGGDPLGGEQATDLVQIYDPVLNSWQLGTPMPTARLELAMAIVDDRLYVIGGATGYMIPPVWEGIAENAMYTPLGYREPIDDPKTGLIVPLFGAISLVAIIVAAGLLLIRERRRRL